MSTARTNAFGFAGPKYSFTSLHFQQGRIKLLSQVTTRGRQRLDWYQDWSGHCLVKEVRKMKLIYRYIVTFMQSWRLEPLHRRPSVECLEELLAQKIKASFLQEDCPPTGADWFFRPLAGRQFKPSFAIVFFFSMFLCFYVSCDQNKLQVSLIWFVSK